GLAGAVLWVYETGAAKPGGWRRRVPGGVRTRPVRLACRARVRRGGRRSARPSRAPYRLLFWLRPRPRLRPWLRLRPRPRLRPQPRPRPKPKPRSKPRSRSKPKQQPIRCPARARTAPPAAADARAARKPDRPRAHAPRHTAAPAARFGRPRLVYPQYGACEP
ncbi:hypothetical protein CF641_38055, partial [Burkholderia pseudomallei]